MDETGDLAATKSPSEWSRTVSKVRLRPEGLAVDFSFGQGEWSATRLFSERSVAVSAGDCSTCAHRATGPTFTAVRNVAGLGGRGWPELRVLGTSGARKGVWTIETAIGRIGRGGLGA